MGAQKITELGTESVRKLLMKYALPGIIAMTAMSLYNMVDSIFIGHGVGALALSGLTVAKPFMDICAAFVPVYLPRMQKPEERNERRTAQRQLFWTDGHIHCGQTHSVFSAVLLLFSLESWTLFVLSTLSGMFWTTFSDLFLSSCFSWLLLFFVIKDVFSVK